MGILSRVGRRATEVIATFGAGQYGTVARWQLLRKGLGAGLIDHRVARGDLLPLPEYRGVYAVGHRALTRSSHLMAATLATRAVLSHASAAEHWGLQGRARVIETTRRASGHMTPRLIVHRSATLDDHDRTMHERIPVTTVPRTLADISTRLTLKQLERAVMAAERQRLLDWNAMDELLERRHYGTMALREVLGRADPRTNELAPGLEEIFLQLWNAEPRPQPSLQALVAGLRVDFLWPLAMVIVECDGFRYHSGRLKHDEDRIRDMRLRAAGYEVHRATHYILTSHADEFIQTVHSAIIRRSGGLRDLERG